MFDELTNEIMEMFDELLTPDIATLINSPFTKTIKDRSIRIQNARELREELLFDKLLLSLNPKSELL